MSNSRKKSCESLPATLLQTCDYDLEQLHQRVGIDRTAGTYNRQCRLRNMVAEYMNEVLNREDIPLYDLTLSFISDYASYLSVQCKLLDGTVWLACQWLKGIVKRAYQRGWMQLNPFAEFHATRNIRPREYLSEDELHRLMTCKLTDKKQAFFRDIFLFSALTGLSFADINNLCRKDIRVINGQPWILSLRKKTHTIYQVRVLPLAAEIIRRYENDGDFVFGPIVYRTLAKHIPAIMLQCGITRHITFHCARHSFAIMCLDAGLPIESISRMMGHTNITTTQIYARITLGKLNQDMDQLLTFCQEHLNT